MLFNTRLRNLWPNGVNTEEGGGRSSQHHGNTECCGDSEEAHPIQASDTDGSSEGVTSEPRPETGEGRASRRRASQAEGLPRSRTEWRGVAGVNT